MTTATEASAGHVLALDDLGEDAHPGGDDHDTEASAGQPGEDEHSGE